MVSPASSTNSLQWISAATASNAIPPNGFLSACDPLVDTAYHERVTDQHGFKSGYTTVKTYVREHGRRSREMFVPLAHGDGHAQADFGEAMVVIGGVEKKADFIAFDLPNSDACFVRGYPAAV